MITGTNDLYKQQLHQKQESKYQSTSNFNWISGTIVCFKIKVMITATLKNKSWLTIGRIVQNLMSLADTEVYENLAYQH